MAENYSVVDFSGLSATSDGNTLLYADNQVCKSDKTLGQLIDGKIAGKGYATETFVTGKIENLSGTVSTEYATKEELGKVGNFIVTEGDDEGPTLELSEAETKNIYLVKDAGATGTDQYREWIVTENEGTKAWTCIGDTSMDLSDYALSADVDTGLALKEDKVFVAEYNVTTYQEIKDAYDAGKQIVCKYINQDNNVCFVANLTQYAPPGNVFMFAAITWIGTYHAISCSMFGSQTIWQDQASDIPSTLTAGTNLVLDNGVISVNTNGTANGTYAFVEGNSTIASGYASHAEGFGTQAIQEYSHAEGYKTTANGNNTHAEGSETSAAGSNAHAEGYSTVANNQGAHAEGGNTSAVGYCSHTEGNSTSAYGSQAHAEGNQTSAYGSNSHSEGQRTYAGNDEAHAEGYGTSALYGKTHAEGYESIANGEASHAEGYHTSAVMSHSHTEGEYTSAGYTAHAEGSYTLAAGGASHAEGYYTSATEYYSHAAGQYTSAGYNSETVVGKYNIISPNYDSNPLFVVGNGGWNTQTYSYERSDAFVVLENGTASATKLAISGVSDVGAKITNIETTIGNIETILQSI